MRVEKSVSNVDANRCGVDGRSVGIGDSEIGGAGSKASINLGDGLRVGRWRRGLRVQNGVREQRRGKENGEWKIVTKCKSHN